MTSATDPYTGPRRGFMFVLSSPSGAGKTTLSRRLLGNHPGVSISISVTTRPKRPGEIDKQDYHFIDDAEFTQMVTDGTLLEHATVFDYKYGTPAEQVEQALN
ncbi:MAG: guanylate kinase, partial [Rickettsiales bacterium]|nr:guanylate kinase [Rickettsiales bacterium]